MVGSQLSSSMVQPQNPNCLVRPQLFNTMVGTHFSPSLSDPTSQHHSQTPTSTVCLNDRQPNCLLSWPKVNLQLSLFQNLQILRTIASRHDVIQPISYLGFIMTIVIVISFVREHKLYPVLCT